MNNDLIVKYNIHVDGKPIYTFGDQYDHRPTDYNSARDRARQILKEEAANEDKIVGPVLVTLTRVCRVATHTTVHDFEVKRVGIVVMIG